MAALTRGALSRALVAIRGGGEPDVFPSKDLGLEKAWATVSGADSVIPGELTRQSEFWRPWRSYAANLLWRSLSP